MSPVPEQRTRPAYLDPKDRLNLSHIIEAAALVQLGHLLLHIERDRSRAIYVFNRSASADLARLRRITEEILAHRERTFPHLRTTQNGDPRHEQPAR